MILHNGTILTLNPQIPVVEALGIRGDRIAAAGSLAEVRAAVGPESDAIDLGGRTAIPGFNDDHIHLLGMAEYFSRPNLAGLNENQIVEKLLESYKDAKPGELLIGSGWDYPACPSPNRLILDRAFPANPVILTQYSGHGSWVNTRLLTELSITRATKDPVGGRILRDAVGDPTGILLDAAARPLHVRRAALQKKDPEHSAHVLEASLRFLREKGITSVQDNTWDPAGARLFQRFAAEERLTVRVSCWADGRTKQARRRLEGLHFDGTVLSLGPVKYFLDGTFSTKTAWLLDPYPDDPANIGIPMGKGDWIDGLVRALAARHRQGAFHAIGDRAVRGLVDAVEKAARRYRWTPELRMRIEHGQLIAAEDLSRIRDLGMVVSAQPHALGTPEKDINILGRARAGAAYPYRSMIDAGVHFAFGSDCPGESSFDPLLAVHYTVNRDSEERITVEESLRAYTAGSAYAQFMEEEKGTLAIGRLADVAVLSENPLRVRPETIKDILVTMTILGGRVVYDRSGDGGGD